MWVELIIEDVYLQEHCKMFKGSKWEVKYTRYEKGEENMSRFIVKNLESPTGITCLKRNEIKIIKNKKRKSK